MSRVALVSNPASRYNRRNPLLHKVLADRIGDPSLVFTPESPDALPDVTAEIAASDPDFLCVNGGDGSLHTLLTALAPHYAHRPLPALQLLRGGTMNTIAHGIGLSGRPLDILDRLLQHGDHPVPTVARSTLCVDGVQLGFLFGNGIVAHFLEAYYASPDPRPASAVALLARGVASATLGTPLFRRMARPWTGEVIADGVSWGERPWLSVAAGTVDDIGVGFRPFYRAPSSPGSLHAIGLGQNGPALCMELHRIFRAQPLRHPLTRDELSKTLVLRAREPITYMIDGDFHRGGTELTVTVGPTVRFAMPSREWMTRAT